MKNVRKISGIFDLFPPVQNTVWNTVLNLRNLPYYAFVHPLPLPVQMSFMYGHRAEWEEAETPQEDLEQWEEFY